MRGNVLWLSVASFLNDAASEMIYPLLPLFLAGTLGAGAAFVGLVEGAAESASSLLKLASGWMADRTGRRKPLTVSGYGIAALARPLIAHGGGRRGTCWRCGCWTAWARGCAPPRATRCWRSPSRRSGAAPRSDCTARRTTRARWRGPLIASRAAAGAGRRPADGVRARRHPRAADGGWWSRGRCGRRRPPRVPAERAAAPPLPRLRELGPVLPRYLGVLVLFTLGNASDAFLLLRASAGGRADALGPAAVGRAAREQVGVERVGRALERPRGRADGHHRRLAGVRRRLRGLRVRGRGSGRCGRCSWSTACSSG